MCTHSVMCTPIIIIYFTDVMCIRLILSSKFKVKIEVINLMMSLVSLIKILNVITKMMMMKKSRMIVRVIEHLQMIQIEHLQMIQMMSLATRIRIVLEYCLRI